MSVDEDTKHESVEAPADEATEVADHDLVMATARRIITSDAAIIHRLGTV